MVVVTFSPPIADMTTSCTAATLRPYRAISSRRRSRSTKYPPAARSAKALRVPGTSRNAASTSVPRRSISARSEP
jgi:hypothetical protein